MKAVLALIALTTSLSALAAPDCTSEPKSKWMPEAKLQEKLKAEGYQIKKFKVEDSCYEIYGRDKAGKKVEIYFNPVNGDVVKSKSES